MKRFLILVVAMLGLVLAACGGQSKEDTANNTTSKELAKISKTAIEEAENATMENIMFEDAVVEVDGKTIHLIMTVVSDTITVEHAEETAEEFANQLALNYEKENESAEPLWNLYDLKMTIQTDKDNILYEASKKTDSETIDWK